MAQDSVEYTALRGGIDLVSSSLTISPGAALDLFNYEVSHGGGYRRIGGYERFNGSTLASAFTYTTITVDTTTGIAVNTTLVGATSGGIGVVAYIDGLTLVIAIHPYYDDGDVSLVSGEVVAPGVTTTSAETARVIGSEKDYDYLEQVRSWARTYWYVQFVTAADFADVPGAGPIRGLFGSETGEGLIAVRDVDAVTQKFWYASFNEAGTQIWSWPDYDPSVLLFDTGTGISTLPRYATLKGATSGATCTAFGWGVWSGSDAESDTTGYFSVDGLTGAFVDNENVQIETSPSVWTTICKANGASFPYVRSAGGRLETVRHQFFPDRSPLEGIFLADGVNTVCMFAFPAQYGFPIYGPPDPATPTTPTPLVATHLEVHKNFLFMSFSNGSVLHTNLGDPFSINGFLGAAEFNLGAPCTGMKSITGGGLAIYTRKKTFLLEGSDVIDWSLKTIGEDTGAIEHTVQSMGQTYALDDYGLTTLARVQAYGDFSAKALTQKVQKALAEKIVAPSDWWTVSNVTGSIVVRSENQYRLFLSDGSGMSFYLAPNGTVETSTFKYDRAFSCVSVCRSSFNGKDRIFAGSSDESGRVYELDSGPCFDGASIYSVARLPFNSVKSPRTRKTYRLLELETDLGRKDDGEPPALGIYSEIDFGSHDNLAVYGTGAKIGTGMQWEIIDDGNLTYWTSAQDKATSVPLEGTGNNISITITNDSARAQPFILQGAVLTYRPRRADRS